MVRSICHSPPPPPPSKITQPYLSLIMQARSILHLSLTALHTPHRCALRAFDTFRHGKTPPAAFSSSLCIPAGRWWCRRHLCGPSSPSSLAVRVGLGAPVDQVGQLSALLSASAWSSAWALSPSYYSRWHHFQAYTAWSQRAPPCKKYIFTR